MIRSDAAGDAVASIRRGLARPIVLALVILALAGLPPGAAIAADAPAAPVTPDASRIHLSWRAPHGQPRATESLVVACGDTTKVDTLWLTFEPGKDAPGFLGVTATLAIWPTGGDTLSAHWDFGKGQVVKRLKAEFNPEVPGMSQAWTTGGIGRFGYNRSSVVGNIRMIQAVGPTDAAPVKAGTLYPLCRLLVPRPSTESGACAHPVCIEWQWGTMGYAFGDEPEVRLGTRFVTWNSAGGKDACATLRQVGAPKSWKPGAAPSSAAPAHRDTTPH